jgi:hypothetical protein
MENTIDRLTFIAYSASKFLRCRELLASEGTINFAAIEAIRTCIYSFSTCENLRLI